MIGERTASCPNCGGPIAFGLGSSAALVCPHCRYAVVRTDRDLRALGRVADLVPTAAPIAVGDSGTLGPRAFRVAGRVQRDHGSGPWDEWYVGFADGAWGWLAQAQGRWYETGPTAPSSLPSTSLPAWSALPPGITCSLPGAGAEPWTVSEQGRSTVIAAEGELPAPVASGERGAYVDLVGPRGAFATIDYGDGRTPPQLFAGRELAPGELQLAPSSAPRPAEQVALGKVACPSCGAPIELRDAGSERAACSYCYALLDVREGSLALVRKLEQVRLQPRIPLGSKGTLGGQALTVIGFMERCTVVAGITYAWREYLLHGGGGYRWLVEDNGHWTLVTPISAGDLSDVGWSIAYEGKRFRRFSSNVATVRFVVGEFYWKVQVGEQVSATDFIAPPEVLSEERSAGEVVWSHGRYVEPEDVWKAFALSGEPPSRSGVAPAQPNPHGVVFPLVTFAALALAFAATALAIGMRKEERQLADFALAMPVEPTRPGAFRPEPVEDRASYSPSFEVTGGPTLLQVTLQTNVDNGWVGANCALVDEASGEVREFEMEASYYHGVEGGEGWQEGNPSASVEVNQVSSGIYSLRFDPQWGGGSATLPPTASVLVEQQGAGGSNCCLVSLFLLLVPPGVSIFRRFAFEGRRGK